MKRFVSLLLVAAFVFMTVACGFWGENQIPQGWYDSTRNYYPIADDTNCLDYINVVNVTDDYVLVRKNYSEWKNGGTVVHDTLYRLYDNGEYDTLNIKRLPRESGLPNEVSTEYVVELNGTTYAVLKSLNTVSWIARYYFVSMDFESEVFGEPIELSELNNYLNVNSGILRNVFEVDGELLFHFSGREENVATIIKMHPDFSCERIDTSALNDYSLHDSFYSYMLSDEKLLLICNPVEGTVLNFELNINTGIIKEIDFNDSFARGESDLGIEYSTAGNRYCMTDGYRVLSVNPKTYENDILFSFDNSNCNRWEMQQSEMRIVDVAEDSFVFAGMITLDGNSNTYEVVKFKKSEVDFRDGKTILKAANVERNISRNIAEAIYSFNISSDTYYVELTDIFSISKYFDEDDYSYRFSSSANLMSYYEDMMNANTALSTDLSIALMSDDCPDIFLNSDDYSLINNPNLLLDLTPYINGDSGIDVDDYFYYVFENARNNEPTFQIPIAICLDAVYGKYEAHSDLSGFTFEEYQNLVENEWNGCDPLFGYSLRMQAFDELLETVADRIVVDNTINLDVDDFYGVVEYCNSLPEIPLAVQYPDSYNSSFQYDLGHFDGYFSSFVNNQKFYGADRFSVSGMLSYSGDLYPTLEIASSASISASCKNPEGAWEFIKVLLSYEAQSCIPRVDLNCKTADPVNKEAFAYVSETNLNYINSNDEWLSDELHRPIEETDRALIDWYYNLLDTSHVNQSIDPNILAIFNEEMPSYFVGDKSLDEVILIIEDRVQTVFDEASS